MGVIGPHSSGKGQLLRCLAGEWKPAGCSVDIRGKPLTGMRTSVSYVGPQPGGLPEMTCSQMLEFFADSYRLAPHYRPYLVAEALELVGLAGLSATRVENLTRSDCYRLSLARALVTHPVVVVVHGLLDRVEPDLVSDFADILQAIRQKGICLVVGALSVGPLLGLCSHLCILVTDRPLVCGRVSDLLPQLANLRMMQVQFLSGFAQAIHILERAEGVYHLSKSNVTHNLLRFLFDSQYRPFTELLNELQKAGCSIVSVGEDPSFLGHWSA